MEKRQSFVLTSLRSVQKFINDNADRLGDGITKAGVRTRLDKAIQTLDQHRDDQASHAKSALSMNGSQLRMHSRLVRDHMQHVARIARIDLPTTPEFRELRMPAARTGIESLVGAANAMATLASKYASVFVDAGLPADFADQIRAAAAELLAMFGTRRNTRAARAGATAGLSQKLSEARRVVGVIDGFVKSAFRDDDAMMEAWHAVSHPRARNKAASEPAPVVATPVVAAPAPVSAASAPIAATTVPVPAEVTTAVIEAAA